MIEGNTLYSECRWNGFSNTEELRKQYSFAIMYIHNFMRTKPLILVKKRTKLRTKSDIQNIRAKRLSLPFAILNIIRAKHQNRA